ncbi:MAG: DciA family protein [Elusimicrobiota bacterium]
MRKGQVTHISEFVEKFLAKNCITPESYALRLFFSEFIGPKLAKYADLVKLTKDTVFISVKSAVVKNEILIIRRKIIKAVNEFLKSEKIKNLKIIHE